MEWISVKDRLPEYGVFVLTDLMLVCQRVKHATGDYWEDNSCCGCIHDEESIDHWMPLPPPPKE